MSEADPAQSLTPATTLHAQALARMKQSSFPEAQRWVRAAELTATALATARNGDPVRAALYITEAFFLSSPGVSINGQDFDVWGGIVSGASQDAPFESKLVLGHMATLGKDFNAALSVFTVLEKWCASKQATAGDADQSTWRARRVKCRQTLSELQVLKGDFQGALGSLTALSEDASSQPLTVDESFSISASRAGLLFSTGAVQQSLTVATDAVKLAQPQTRGLATLYYHIALVNTKSSDNGRSIPGHVAWIFALAAEKRERRLFLSSLAEGSSFKTMAMEIFAGSTAQFAMEHEAKFGRLAGVPLEARAALVACQVAHDPYLEGLGCGFCHLCGSQPPKLSVCSRCKMAYYCNGDCQKLDYAQHKAVCRAAPASA